MEEQTREDGSSYYGEVCQAYFRTIKKKVKRKKTKKKLIKPSR